MCVFAINPYPTSARNSVLALLASESVQNAAVVGNSDENAPFRSRRMCVFATNHLLNSMIAWQALANVELPPLDGD